MSVDEPNSKPRALFGFVFVAPSLHPPYAFSARIVYICMCFIMLRVACFYHFGVHPPTFRLLTPDLSNAPTHASCNEPTHEPTNQPPAEAPKTHIPGSGFLHSVADSMRESSGIQRHDAKPAASVELSAGEASEAGVVEKVTASIAGVAGASQVLGWGASGKKIKKKKSDVEGDVGAPSVEGGVDVGVPSVEGGVEVPAPEGGMTLPGASVDAGGELSVCGCVFPLVFLLYARAAVAPMVLTRYVFFLGRISDLFSVCGWM